MSDAALAAANIDAEVTPECLSLYLPVNEPIWGSPSGLRMAAGVIGVNTALCLGLGALNPAPDWSTMLLILGVFVGMILLAVGILTLTDAASRLQQRWRDARTPIRELRERIDLTLHAVVTDRGRIPLSDIQSVRIEATPKGSRLIAQSAAGEVIVASHRTERVIAALAEAVGSHAQRRRAALIADGFDPDAPEAIPEALQQLRATPQTST